MCRRCQGHANATDPVRRRSLGRDRAPARFAGQVRHPRRSEHARWRHRTGGGLAGGRVRSCRLGTRPVARPAASGDRWSGCCGAGIRSVSGGPISGGAVGIGALTGHAVSAVYAVARRRARLPRRTPNSTSPSPSTTPAIARRERADPHRVRQVGGIASDGHDEVVTVGRLDRHHVVAGGSRSRTGASRCPRTNRRGST